MKVIDANGKRSAIILLLMLSTIIVGAFPIRHYGTDMLSSNLITALCQDEQGYIWIGTEYGLNKFDGVHVKQYFNDDTSPQSLSDDIVRCLMTDHEGNVWVVNNHGVQRYNRDHDNFESVQFSEGTSANIKDILQTPDGNIWLLSFKLGILEVGQDLKATPVETINQHLRTACGNMFLDSKGRLWIGYDDTGVQMVDTKTHQTHYFEKMSVDVKRTSGIIENNNHQLFALTANSLMQYDEQKKYFETIVTFPTNNVSRLCQLRNGRLLFGTSGNGLWEVNIAKREVTRIQNNADDLDITHEKVNTILEDHKGNLWISCFQTGLLMMSDQPMPFHYLPLNRLQDHTGENDTHLRKMLRTVASDREGRVLVCQEKDGIKHIDRDGHILHHLMKDYTVMTVFEDYEGTYWVGTFRNGLFHVHTQTGKEEWMPHTGTQRVGCITKDKKGNLYTAVFNDGLHSYTPDGKTERTLAGGQLALHNAYLNTLFTDDEGLIWIGHYYGIDVYDPHADRLIDIPIDAALRPAIVYAITQSTDGTIWIGCNKGLFQYTKKNGHQGEWKHYTKHDGLPNNIVCGVVVDNEGSIWVSTYQGLGKLTTDGLFICYYRGNGLEEQSYLRSAYAHTCNDEIIMGNQNGITWFMPKMITPPQFEQEITLTGMRQGNIETNANDNITVSYLNNTFSLLFTTMDFRDPQNVHYEYRFDDEPDDVWHQTSTGVSEIFMTQLSAGHHILLVRAYDNGARSAIKTIAIHVTPPWYRMWWAYLLYLIIIITIALLWWRSYWNKRQAETNEEKIKFFVDISHELRSPLTLIKSPLELLLKEKNDPATTRALRNIERSTNRLLTLTDQILSIRKMEKGQLELHFSETRLGDFVDDICHDYDYQVEQRQLNLTFNNQAPEMMVWIDVDQFDKVVSNLLGNAIKYIADGGEIQVTLQETTDSQAELCIRDNGPGIDETKLQKIFERFYQASAYPTGGQMSYGIGLNLTKKIVDMHGGTITARNRTDGHGSEFIVRIPLGCKHLPQDLLVDNDSCFAQNTKENKIYLTANENSQQRIRRKTDYHIAVVDDDRDMRNFLKAELNGIYHVDVYPDGQKALEGITDTVPDVVVSDVVMPEMNGVELLKRIKSNTKTCHIPVILLTSKTTQEAHIEGIEEGADAYIEKPFNLEILEASIASLINNRNLIRAKYTGIQEQADTVRQIELKGNDAALMERIMKAVNSRIDDSDFNVETLAEDVGLSRTQLHRRMKELTGISVGEFIRNLRLQQAAKLLSAGDVSISQVTYAIGFSTPAHFSAAFKKHFGVSPSEYMAKNAGRHPETSA